MFAGKITLNLKADYSILFAITMYSNGSKTRFNENVVIVKSKTFKIHPPYNYGTSRLHTRDIETIVSKPI